MAAHWSSCAAALRLHKSREYAGICKFAKHDARTRPAHFAGMGCCASRDGVAAPDASATTPSSVSVVGDDVAGARGAAGEQLESAALAELRERILTAQREHLAAARAELDARESACAAQEAALRALETTLLARQVAADASRSDTRSARQEKDEEECTAPQDGLPALDARLRRVDASTPLESLAGSVRRVRVLRVYDGDTVTLAFFDEGVLLHVRKARLLHFDAPEIRPLKSAPYRELHMRAAVGVRAVLVHALAAVGGICWGEFGAPDKYGRDLVELRVLARGAGLPAESLNGMLVARALVLGYEGRTKAEWDAARLSRSIAAAVEYAHDVASCDLETLIDAASAMPK